MRESKKLSLKKVADKTRIRETVLRDFEEDRYMNLPSIYVKSLKILSELHAQNIPLLLIEQNARAALKIATRGYVMETGNIAMEGKTEELLENPRIVLAYLGG